MRRIVRTIVGSIVLLVGLVMLVLPGPAVLVIPLGLAILAIDFPWAKVVMQKARIWFTRKKQSAPQSPNHPTAKMP
jgi:tellurite resistance protein TerC